MSFLNAEWRKLAMANYAVEPKFLEKYVPNHTELDLWNGTCYVSLVAFMFLNTKVMGVKVPMHVNFEEANLRFYVKYNDNGNWKRGVVFVKEIVPKAAITFIANTVYKEHYQTLKMKHEWSETENERSVEYFWEVKDEWQGIKLIAEKESQEIAVGSEAEFITEHYWGYSKNEEKTVEYEVTHPRWQHYPVLKHEIEIDFGKTYGEEFAFMNKLEPKSIFLAEGSEITVESKHYL